MKQNAFLKLMELCPECKSFETFLVELKEDNWGRKLGGISTKQRRHGFLNPEYGKQSTIWKSRGGQIGTRNWHIRMKNEAPEEYRKIQYHRFKQSLKYKHEYLGQKYRNRLELDVAKVLTARGLQFEYEQFVRCEDNFFFPDFVLGETVVECTFWHDTEQKAKELVTKIRCYQKIGFELVLIVTTEKYVQKYSKLLYFPNVRVITCNELSGLLDGNLGE